MESKIFKAYDIRGVYPEEINGESAYRIGQAFAVFIKKISSRDKPQVVASRDNRLSSDSLFGELKKGIVSQGVDVIDIGLATTPMFYFAVIKYGCDGGIDVTASHNPPQYNGFKMVRNLAIPISEDSGIREIEELALSNNFPKIEQEGSAIGKEVISEYVDSNKEKEIFKTKIVVDTANSVSGVLVPRMLDNAELVHIFAALDGSFPNHEPDPLKKENIKMLQEAVVENKADLGVGFDGDGDRVFFVDERGEIISSDLMLSLVSSIVLREKPQSRILYDIRCSNIVREAIEGLKGEAVPSRVGHSFIKALMREKDIVFGGEYSGHYYLKQGDNYFESPYFVIFSVLKEMKNTGKKLSDLIGQFRKYYHSGEINFKVGDKIAIIENIKDKYREGKLSNIDGVRIDFDDWWFSLRSSNTEPVLRLIIEAKTQDLMEEKLREFESIIME